MNTDPARLRELLLDMLDPDYPLSMAVFKRVATDRYEVAAVVQALGRLVQSGQAREVDKGYFLRAPGTMSGQKKGP